MKRPLVIFGSSRRRAPEWHGHPAHVALPLLLALLISIASAIAQSPTSPPPISPLDPSAPNPPLRAFHPGPQVRIDVLIVSLPVEKTLPLLPALRDPARIDAAQKQILAMIARGEAELIDWPQITTLSENRAVTESNVEHRYPVEFEQPQEPQTFGSSVRPMTPEQRATHLLGALALIPPLTIESKNTGTAIEVEPSISPDARAVTIQINALATSLDRMEDSPAGKDAAGTPLSVRQPVFRTHRIDTTLTLRDGEHYLLHVSHPIEPEDRMQLFLLGVKILPPLKTAAPAQAKK